MTIIHNAVLARVRPHIMVGSFEDAVIGLPTIPVSQPFLGP